MSKVKLSARARGRMRATFYDAMRAEFARLEGFPPDRDRVRAIKSASGRIAVSIELYVKSELLGHAWPTRAEATQEIISLRKAIGSINERVEGRCALSGAARLLLGDQVEALDRAMFEMGSVERRLEDVLKMERSKLLGFRSSGDALLFKVVSQWSHGVGTRPGKTRDAAGGCLATLNNALLLARAQTGAAKPLYTFASLKRAIDRVADSQGTIPA